MLEGVEECAAHGWVTLLNAPFSRDPGEREQLAVSALSIARRFGEVDLEIEALSLLGESYVVERSRGRGHADARRGDGRGDRGPAARPLRHSGEICCRLLSACESALDMRRATEWLSMVDRYVVWTDFVRPTCRTHYGGILIALGRWADAEAELLAAIDGFDRGYRREGVHAALRLADLRVRQGRLEEAERLIEGGEWHPTARRLAATIALARGDTALASELGELCAEGSELADPTCAPALELLIVTRLAIGDVDAAREAAGRLEIDRARVRPGAPRGLRRARRGARAWRRKRDERAAAQLARAVELFASLESSAGGRAGAARAGAHARGVGAAAAAREGKLAIAAFDRLGALPDADASAASAAQPRCGRRAGMAARSDGADAPRDARSSACSPKAARTLRSRSDS